jgi:8-amino-7-oxononanoate synthase
MIQKKLLTRKLRPIAAKNKAQIVLESSRTVWDFSSNDYLGLIESPQLKKVAKAMIDQHGLGSGASRLLSGDYDIFHQLEARIAELQQKESGLVFNSGYQANLGIISTLLGKGDAVFADKAIHASIIDGIKLSGAKLFRFHHNDVNHLEDLLKKNRADYKSALIVTESVFSMDGDLAPIKELVALKQAHNTLLMVDEAHAIGVFGPKGAGLVSQTEQNQNIDLIVGTFGKACGGFGAWLACSKELKDYLINFCRSFIYTTALPPAVIAWNLASLDLIAKDPARSAYLLQLAQKTRHTLAKQGFKTRGESQIIPIIIGSQEKTNVIASDLQEAGYRVLPINPPTVPKGESRLRLTLSYHHPEKVIEEFLVVLAQIAKKHATI